MARNMLITLAFVACLIMSGLPANATPIIELRLLDPQIIFGENFDVEVWMNDDDSSPVGEGLLAFSFDVTTVGSVFAFQSHAVGPSFEDDSDLVPPQIAGSTFPAKTGDEILLATLTFNTLGIGNGKLNVLGLVDDLFLGLVYEVQWFDIDASLDIKVNDSTAPVPEPISILLFGTGIVGIGGYVKKKLKG